MQQHTSSRSSTTKCLHHISQQQHKETTRRIGASSVIHNTCGSKQEQAPNKFAAFSTTRSDTTRPKLLPAAVSAAQDVLNPCDQNPEVTGPTKNSCFSCAHGQGSCAKCFLHGRVIITMFEHHMRQLATLVFLHTQGSVPGPTFQKLVRACPIP